MSQVSVELPDMEGAEFLDMVVEAAARQMLRTWTAEGPNGERAEISTKLGLRIEDAILEAIREQAQAAAPKIAEEMLQEGVRKADAYGQPKGERTPLKTIVAEEATKALSQGGGMRGQKGSLLEEMIRNEVTRELRSELRETLDAAKTALVEAVGEEASKAFASAMKQALDRAKLG